MSRFKADDFVQSLQKQESCKQNVHILVSVSHRYASPAVRFIKLSDKCIGQLSDGSPKPNMLYIGALSYASLK